jgi:hypothetical protein
MFACVHGRTSAPWSPECTCIETSSRVACQGNPWGRSCLNTLWCLATHVYFHYHPAHRTLAWTEILCSLFCSLTQFYPSLIVSRFYWPILRENSSARPGLSANILQRSTPFAFHCARHMTCSIIAKLQGCTSDVSRTRALLHWGFHIRLQVPVC